MRSMRSSTLLAIATLVFASARDSHTTLPGISLRMKAMGAVPGATDVRGHFRDVSRGHDYNRGQHKGPNPKARTPRFNKHAHF
jgi:hypothetical protein